MTDVKLLPYTSPATGRQRLRLVYITDAGEWTFMCFWPREEAIAREYAQRIMRGGNPDKLRLPCSEDRFRAEPVLRTRRRGRPRKAVTS